MVDKPQDKAGWLIARDGEIQHNGVALPFVEIQDLIKKNPNLTILGEQLWLFRIPLQEESPNHLKVYIYGSRRLCPKCGYTHQQTEPGSQYKPDLNLLKRWCGDCGYEWWEKCKDDTEPYIEYFLIHGGHNA